MKPQTPMVLESKEEELKSQIIITRDVCRVGVPHLPASPAYSYCSADLNIKFHWLLVK